MGGDFRAGGDARGGGGLFGGSSSCLPRGEDRVPDKLAPPGAGLFPLCVCVCVCVYSSVNRPPFLLSRGILRSLLTRLRRRLTIQRERERARGDFSGMPLNELILIISIFLSLSLSLSLTHTQVISQGCR